MWLATTRLFPRQWAVYLLAADNCLSPKTGYKPSITSSCKGLGLTRALGQWRWGLRCRRARGGGAGPRPVEHDAQPRQGDQHQLIAKESGNHGKTPSYRWSNEGIVPGFQVAEISRRLEVDNRTSCRACCAKARSCSAASTSHCSTVCASTSNTRTVPRIPRPSARQAMTRTMRSTAARLP